MKIWGRIGTYDNDIKYLNINTPFCFQKQPQINCPPTITDEFKYYLYMITQGNKIFASFVKEPGVHYYLLITLYYLCKDINDYLSEKEKLVKRYCSNIFECVSDEYIDLSKALESVTSMIPNISFAIDLCDSIIDKFIIRNNCSQYFKNKYEPYEILDSKKSEVDEMIKSISIENIKVK